jgi:4-amino-4-deoxy-L-arabinose transferase-like glycosyltransferase
MNQRWFNILAVIIVLLGAGLRLPGLGTRSLWFDEALAADNSRGTLAETVAQTRVNNSSPILYPLILYAVQKVGDGAVAVRAVSFTSSTLLIVLVAMVGKQLIGPISSLMAAVLVAFSPSQIHYAQEVREYAFSSLFAGMMTFAYLDYLQQPTDGRRRIRLFLLLGLCPLIQYGLVLFGCGVLLALVWSAVVDHTVPWRDVLVAGAGLGIVGLFSLLFTLRYQLGADVWYLDGALFRAGKTNLVRFLYHNTSSLLMFLTTGSMAFDVVILGLAFILAAPVQPCAKAVRKLLICAWGVALLAALAHQYPFGGVRQCLYLAPLVGVAIAVGLQELLAPTTGERTLLRISLVILVLFASGIYGIAKEKPYDEVENSQPVLRRLKELAAPEDDVYIYYGARPAFEFYGDRLGFPVRLNQEAQSQWSLFVADTQGERLIFGGHHRERPEEYAPEILSAVRPESRRLWLVFSHVMPDEDQRIMHDLKSTHPDWKVSEPISTANAALYEVARVADR